MKKCLIALLALCLCSCGTQPSESEPVVSEQAVQQETTIQVEITEEITTEEATQSETEAATETEPKAEDKTEPQTEDLWAEFNYVSRDEYESPENVYSDDNLSVDCCGWAVADDFLSVKFEIENKTADNLIIKSSHTSINGYDIDIRIYDTITAGKKKILYAEAKDKDIQSCGMTGRDINQAEFHFTGIDENSYSTLFETDVINIPIEQNFILKQ